MSNPPFAARARRTFWHLEGLKRRPSDYDITSSRLLYSRGRFEINVPISDWYSKYQLGSRVVSGDLEAFRDPRETTYSKYVEIQKAKEVFVDGLLAAMQAKDYDRKLTPSWLGVLEQVMAPLRYPIHGLQMVAAYLGQMAPSGRIVIAALFQTADEVRRIQRLSYRVAQLRQIRPEFAKSSQQIWENAELWQPLRQVVERLLVTYDWAETFVGLNVVLKPAVDELFMTQFGALAASQGDEALEKLFLSLKEDSAWHQVWSHALLDLLLESDGGNSAVIEDFIERWSEPTLRAVRAFAPVFDELAEFEPRPSSAEALANVEEICRRNWSIAGRAKTGAAQQPIHETRGAIR
jgi:toluene monooxygenase system protein E